MITAVGYENTSYFYRVFQKRFRMTPGEYRKQKGLENKDNVLEK